MCGKIIAFRNDVVRIEKFNQQTCGYFLLLLLLLDTCWPCTSVPFIEGNFQNMVVSKKKKKWLEAQQLNNFIVLCEDI